MMYSSSAPSKASSDASATTNALVVEAACVLFVVGVLIVASSTFNVSVPVTFFVPMVLYAVAVLIYALLIKIFVCVINLIDLIVEAIDACFRGLWRRGLSRKLWFEHSWYFPESW